MADIETAAAIPLEAAQLWYQLEALTWRALLVLPVDEHSDASGLVTGLLETARGAGRLPLPLLATSATPQGIGELALELETGRREGKRVLAVSKSVLVDTAALSLAAAADAVLLCVTLGRSTRQAALRSATLVGRSRVLGSVCLA